RGLDDIELGVDMDLAQLVDQEGRRIAINRQRARLHLGAHALLRTEAHPTPPPPRGPGPPGGFSPTWGPSPGRGGSLSADMPHMPSLGGCMVPPIWPSPSLAAMKARRSSASDSARRISGLSKGAASRFTRMLVLLFIDVVSHTARGD